MNAMQVFKNTIHLHGQQSHQLNPSQNHAPPQPINMHQTSEPNLPRSQTMQSQHHFEQYPKAPLHDADAPLKRAILDIFAPMPNRIRIPIIDFIKKSYPNDWKEQIGRVLLRYGGDLEKTRQFLLSDRFRQQYVF
jgi:hypothetical protein